MSLLLSTFELRKESEKNYETARISLKSHSMRVRDVSNEILRIL